MPMPRRSHRTAMDALGIDVIQGEVCRYYGVTLDDTVFLQL